MLAAGPDVGSGPAQLPTIRHCHDVGVKKAGLHCTPIDKLLSDLRGTYIIALCV